MIAYCQGAIIKNNVIADNYASGAFNGGGGVYVDWQPIVLENNTIVDNISGDQGGGVISTGTTTTFLNCIVYGNRASNGSDQIMGRFGGKAKVKYTCMEGGYAGSTIGMITDDPMILDTTSYYLSSNSPCIDTGKDFEKYNDNANPSSPNTALFPSQGTIKNDMGAYGGSSVQQIVGIKEINSFVQGINFLFSNPNIDNTISISSTIKTTLEMSIFGFDGKRLSSRVLRIEKGVTNIPIGINQSSFVVFRDENGGMKLLKILKK